VQLAIGNLFSTKSGLSMRVITPRHDSGWGDIGIQLHSGKRFRSAAEKHTLYLPQSPPVVSSATMLHLFALTLRRVQFKQIY